MRAFLLAAAALTVGAATALAQDPWMNVRSWSGTITIEATDVRKNDWYTAKMTYRATGGFTIPDEMLPAGSHVRWPMPGADALSDPNKAATAFDRWQAHVVATCDVKGVDEQGKPFAVTCKADHEKRMKVGVEIDPVAPNYKVMVSAPEAIFQCSNPTFAPANGHLQQVEFELTGPRGAPGRVFGSKAFPVPAGTIKVRYDMAPSR